MSARVSGVGLGLRRAYASALFAEPPAGLAFLELHPENYLERGGVYARMLAEARERFPIFTHGLTFGVGAAEPFAPARLTRLARFVHDVGAVVHSDHLCFVGEGGRYTHDLLPLPRTDEAVRVCAARIAELSHALGRAVAIEPISFYLDAHEAPLTELAFVNAVLAESGAQLLLDVNNVFVNAQNFGFDPYAFIAGLPLERVVQLHVAGHERADDVLIDTHAAPVNREVYGLYRFTLERLARPIPVLLERDDNFPEFAVLCAEFSELTRIYDDVLGAHT